jgi:sigma-B regulation protein RsbU (phosphoserine phosphatase)
VWWPELIFTLIVVCLTAVFFRISRKLRSQVLVLERARERVEAEEKRVFYFLHTIGEALSADMRADDLNRVIAEGAVQITEANGGAVYVPQAKGEGLRRGYGTSDDTVIFPLPAEAGKAPDVLATFLRWHTAPAGEGIIGTVWREGIPLLISGDDPRLPKGAFSSVMVAPLSFSGQRLGVIYVTRKAGVEPFLQSAFTIFKSIAEQSAFALHSSAVFHEAAEKRRLDEDLAVAHEIQRILLPNSAPEVAGYQIAGVNIPAKQVSGDYYDYLPVDPQHCGVAIADVSGKGVPASLIMAMCRSVLRTQATGQLSPAKVLHEVNAQLFPDIKEDMFISMAYAILDQDSSEIRLCRAGHDAPLLFRAKDKSVSRINPPGMALGIDGGNVFNRVTGDFTITLESEDCLILYTDGITEALDSHGDEFGLQSVIESVLASAKDGAAAIITRLTDDLRAFIGPHPQNDDITLIAIRKR